MVTVGLGNPSEIVGIHDMKWCFHENLSVRYDRQIVPVGSWGFYFYHIVIEKKLEP